MVWCAAAGLELDAVQSACMDMAEDCRRHGTRGRLGSVLQAFIQRWVGCCRARDGAHPLSICIVHRSAPSRPCGLCACPGPLALQAPARGRCCALPWRGVGEPHLPAAAAQVRAVRCGVQRSAAQACFRALAGGGAAWLGFCHPSKYRA